MKKFLILPLAAVFALQFFSGEKAFTRSTGAPAGNTGGLGETSCIKGGCHAGTTFPNSTAFSVLLNGSSTNSTYNPGQTYGVTVKLTAIPGPDYGFQVMAVDSTGASQGTITAASGTTITTGNGRTYLTHSTPAVSPDWSFTWKAPASGKGKITFYAAIFAGSNNATSKIYTGSASFSELPVGVSPVFNIKALNVYPNPATEIVNTVFTLPTDAEVNVSLHTLNGQLVYEGSKSFLSAGEHTLRIPVGLFPNGNYMVHINAGNNTAVKPLVIKK
jgi:Secretion system C-terminal sorting domain/Reeler domain